jgi:hypothetical protein
LIRVPSLPVAVEARKAAMRVLGKYFEINDSSTLNAES